MPYCVQCGGRYVGFEQFCNKCGQRFGKMRFQTDPQMEFAAGGYTEPAISKTKVVIVDALREARTEEREERRKSRNYKRAMRDLDESLETYLKCIGVLGMFHGMSLIGANFLPMLNGPVGFLLVSVAILSGLLKVIIDVKHGHQMIRSLFVVTTLGLLVYGLEYGLFWYIKNELMAHPGNLFTFKLPATTPTPRVLIK